MAQFTTKEQQTQLAEVYLGLARQLESTKETPKQIAGALFEKHCHQHDLAKDNDLTMNVIARALKNVVREYIRELMRNDKMSVEDIQKIVCVDVGCHVLRQMGIDEIHMRDSNNTIIKL